MLFFFKSTIPHIVYTGLNYLEHDTDEVICDSFKAVGTLYDHFHSLNYESIGFIGLVASINESRNDYHRYSSYLSCLAKHNLLLKADWVHSSQDNAEHGIRVPDDLAIASIDNINVGQFLTPSLTTIDVSKIELARLSINMLMDKIDNRRDKNIRLDIPHELIIRESCGYKKNKL